MIENGRSEPVWCLTKKNLQNPTLADLLEEQTVAHRSTLSAAALLGEVVRRS